MSIDIGLAILFLHEGPFPPLVEFLFKVGNLSFELDNLLFKIIKLINKGLILSIELILNILRIGNFHLKIINSIVIS